VLGKRAITPDTALRLARYFGASERFWLGLQMDFDLEEAKNVLVGTLERPRASARHEEEALLWASRAWSPTFHRLTA
jgi:plasmid maintenance system antidote protein VapI